MQQEEVEYLKVVVDVVVGLVVVVDIIVVVDLVVVAGVEVVREVVVVSDDADGAGQTVPVSWLRIQDFPSDTLEYTPDNKIKICITKKHFNSEKKQGGEFNHSFFDQINHILWLTDQFDRDKDSISPVDLFLEIDRIDLLTVNLEKDQQEKIGPIDLFQQLTWSIHSRSLLLKERQDQFNLFSVSNRTKLLSNLH